MLSLVRASEQHEFVEEATLPKRTLMESHCGQVAFVVALRKPHSEQISFIEL
jgi:hypothetical protein